MLKKSNYLYIISIPMIGILSGISAILLKLLVEFIGSLSFSGKLSWSFIETHHSNAFLQEWVIIVPVLGSLLVTFIIKNFAPEAKGHGVAEVIYSIRHRHAHMRPIIIFMKALASAISIGSGGSAGIEGPMVQIGSTIGSLQHQFIKKINEEQKIILLACGAASGLGAIFNAPMTGIIFAMEIVLPKISFSSIIAIMISTIVAVVSHNYLIGSDVYFGNFVKENIMINDISLNHFIFLGLLLGISSAIFIIFITKTEDFFETIKIHVYLRNAVGMFILGCILYLTATYSGFYYIDGIGYSTIHDILNSQIISYKFLLILFVLKLIATSITFASGASGGIFYPALYVGACLGAIYYLLGVTLDPSINGQLNNFVICGMAGLVGGITGASVASIILLIETTHNYFLITPLIISVATTSVVRKILIKDTMFTHSLHKKQEASKRLY